jgi:hypothetical protein
MVAELSACSACGEWCPQELPTVARLRGKSQQDGDGMVDVEGEQGKKQELTYTHARTHSLTRSLTHSLLHTRARARTHTHTHTHTRAHTHTHTHTFTYARTHAHGWVDSLTHSLTFAYSLTHSRTHAHIRVGGSSRTNDSVVVPQSSYLTYDTFHSANCLASDASIPNLTLPSQH